MKSFIAAVGERLTWRHRPGNESGLGDGGFVPGRPNGDVDAPGSPNGDGEPAPERPKGMVPLEIAVMNAGHCDWIA